MHPPGLMWGAGSLSAGRMSSLTPVQERLAHVAFRARRSETGIGAAVLRAEVSHGTREWTCIVGDGGEWHYVRVIGTDIGPFQNLPPEVVEDGIERFAATLPAANLLQQLLHANPLHIDHFGNVSD